jgi:hypothetical protein
MIDRTSRCRIAMLLLLAAAPLGAQEPPQPSPAAPFPTPLILPGSDADDRQRTLQLFGRADTEGYLLRSPSAAIAGRRADGLSWGLVAPEVHTVWNSAIPFSLNQGTLWAGRGLSTRALAGFHLSGGGLTLVVAPELVHSQNRPFAEVLPAGWDDEGARVFLPPWHSGRHSVDLPLRFGAEPLTSLEWGQSTLAYATGAVAVGVSTESQWWGPGIRNAIVMSNNAPGLPHAFVRTASPAATALGDFEAKWIVGSLSGSGHLEPAGDGDGRRALSALVATFRPAREPNLSLGLARAVYSPVDGIGSVPARFADALIRWPQAVHDPDEHAEAEQLLSLFGRWILPDDGFEFYVEWARHELPTSLRDALLAPEHSQGYTLGLQWANELRAGSVVRLQAEHTYLEYSPTVRARPIGSYYASRSVPHGYTHRGRVIGAAVGPGASGQWLAADHLWPGARIGAFLGRVRWANDAFYERTGGPVNIISHDVSFFGGVRTGFDVGAVRMNAEYTTGTRFNYLFQNPACCWETRHEATNVRNHTLQLTATLRGVRPRARPEALEPENW